jgi:cytosolic 5'-nucleotidase 3
VQKSKELYEKYLPIEFDPEMSMKEKIPYMEEWWRKSHELIIENKMSKEILRNAVKRINRIQLRFYLKKH